MGNGGALVSWSRIVGRQPALPPLVWSCVAEVFFWMRHTPAWRALFLPGGALPHQIYATVDLTTWSAARRYWLVHARAASSAQQSGRGGPPNWRHSP